MNWKPCLVTIDPDKNSSSETQDDGLNQQAPEMQPSQAKYVCKVQSSNNPIGGTLELRNTRPQTEKLDRVWERGLGFVASLSTITSV